MPDNPTPQSNQHRALKYGLIGLLLGSGGAALFRTLKDIADLKSTQHQDQSSLDTMLVKTKEEDGKRSGFDKYAFTQGLRDSVTGGGKALLEGAGRAWDGVTGATEGARSSFVDFNTRNALLLAGLLAGGYGVNQLWDTMKKSEAEQKADDIRNYYYRRVMDVEGGKPGALVKQIKRPLNRDERPKLDKKKKDTEDDRTEKRSFAPRDFLLWSLLAALPLGAGYMVKRYLDETQPKLSRPSADSGMDPRAQIRRIARVESKGNNDFTEEELTELEKSYSDYLGTLNKAASISEPLNRAWEVGHLLQVFLSNEKRASLSILPDLLRVVENEGTDTLRKFAHASDLDGAVEYLEKRGSALEGAPSTPVSRHLAAELIGADAPVAELVRPILCAEYLEEYPDTVKIAGDSDPLFMEGVLSLSRAVSAASSQRLLAPLNEGLEKTAGELPRDYDSLHDYAQFLNGLFSPRKEASTDSYRERLREQIFKV